MSAAVTRLSDVRPAVVRFAMLMERKLRDNDHKGGWYHEDASELLRRLREEADELGALALDMIQQGMGTPDWRSPIRANIGAEAADVANFAMMIADVCGALP